MEHTHSLTTNDPHQGYAFTFGIAINLIFIIAEVIMGVISNSTALISDAGHNFSDVLTLGFSLFAIKISQRKPTAKYTYGFRRSTILIALLNTMLLLVTVGYISWETASRIGKSVEVNSMVMIIVASAGILVNGFTAWLFQKGKKNDMNIRAAFLHFVADALVSLGVVVGGVLIIWTGLYWIDSVISFIIVAVILYSTYHVLVESVNLAIDAVPENIDHEAVRNFLQNHEGVSDIHDLHIWALSTTEAALTVHLETSTQTDVAFISGIQKELQRRFGIGHSTIQVEYGTIHEEGENVCN